MQTGRGHHHHLDAADADAIGRGVPHRTGGVTPIVIASGGRSSPETRTGRPDEIWASTLQLPDDPQLANANRASSSRDSDIRAAAKVCVVGDTVADNLFQTRNCVGTHDPHQEASPSRSSACWTPKGANLFGQDQDDIVLAPYTTIKKRVAARRSTT